jgi:dUTPase
MFRILDPNNITQASYQIGDRVGQLLLVKLGEFDLTQVKQLSASGRGSGAYGSTGR